MSDGEPIRGGFFRGFLVGTLMSLLVTVFLTVVFPVDGQSDLAPSAPPEVVVDVPTARSSLGEATSGVETPSASETAAPESEPAPITPEVVAEPEMVTETAPAAVDNAIPEVPEVEAEVAAEETVQPDLQGFSADVTTPAAEAVAESAPRSVVSEMQAAEMNALLEGPDVSVEPMIPLEPLGGNLEGEADLGNMAAAEINVEPMIPLENAIEPMVDIAPDADLAVSSDPTEMAGADQVEAGIMPVGEETAETAGVEEPANPEETPLEPGTEPEAGTETPDASAEVPADGAAPVDPAAEPGVAAEGETVPEEGTVASGALSQFAAAFEHGGDRPLLAVVLVDAGAAGQEIAALAEIGMPLTIGIPSDVPDAIERTAAYRAAGFEVVAIAPEAGVGAFRRGQNFEEVPLQLEAIFSAVPEAVAVMDPPGGELPKDNQLVRAVLDGLKPTGHALLTQAGGFNSVGDLAAEKGVFSGTVMREIETVDAVNFAMSRAALQAGKTGSAVIMANTRPAMVKEVVQWLLSASARSVALAPVSASLAR